MTKLSRLDIESLPHYRKKTHREWSAACPQCNGKDRFIFWPDRGNYYCRRCDLKGFILETDQALTTPEQRDAWKRAEEERQRKEAMERVDAITRLQGMIDRVIHYHRMVKEALGYWASQGLSSLTIERYQLGYCPKCPTEPSSASFTIPYFQNGNLVHLRHRLQTPNGHGKYRPEFAGLGNQLFNSDILKPSDEIPFGLLEPGECLIVEGEVKAMVLDQIGFSVVGLPGANSWRGEWGQWFKGQAKVYVALDPGAEPMAWRVGGNLKEWGVEVAVCMLPYKPDDMFVLYGASIEDFIAIIRQGRIIR